MQAKAAQFGQYAERFTGHAATYTDQDQAAAAKFDAIAFPEVNVTPKPPPDEPPPSTRWCAGCPVPTPTRRPTARLTQRGCSTSTTAASGSKRTSPPAPTRPSSTAKSQGVAYLTGPPPPGTDPAAQAPPGSTDILWRATAETWCISTKGRPDPRPRSRNTRPAGSAGELAMTANGAQRSRQPRTTRYKHNREALAKPARGDFHRRADPQQGGAEQQTPKTTARRTT